MPIFSFVFAEVTSVGQSHAILSFVFAEMNLRNPSPRATRQFVHSQPLSASHAELLHRSIGVRALAAFYAPLRKRACGRIPGAC